MRMNRDRVICRLVNTEKNKVWLRRVPHREFLDLSIVYQQMSKNGVLAYQITWNDANDSQLTESELYELAMKNTKRLCPMELKPMSGIAKEAKEIVNATRSEKEESYFVSNQVRRHGAIAILYEGALEKISQITESNLYIMPSSTHECIVAPVDTIPSLEALQERLQFINQHLVDEEDRLSNQIYHYDMETKEVTQVTHSPYTDLCQERTDWSEESLNFGREMELDMSKYEHVQNEEGQISM